MLTPAWCSSIATALRCGQAHNSGPLNPGFNPGQGGPHLEGRQPWRRLKPRGRPRTGDHRRCVRLNTSVPSSPTVTLAKATGFPHVLAKMGHTELHRQERPQPRQTTAKAHRQLVVMRPHHTHPPPPPKKKCSQTSAGKENPFHPTASREVPPVI